MASKIRKTIKELEKVRKNGNNNYGINNYVTKILDFFLLNIYTKKSEVWLWKKNIII